MEQRIDPLDLCRLLGRFTVGHAGGCWLWTASVDSGGYGQFMTRLADGRRVNRRAHRYLYELLVGPIPPDRELDHLCEVTRCVNPAHLEPVTHAENVRRAAALHPERHAHFRARDAEGIAICKNGHLVAGANARPRRTPAGNAAARCVACAYPKRAQLV